MICILDRGDLPLFIKRAGQHSSFSRSSLFESTLDMTKAVTVNTPQQKPGRQTMMTAKRQFSESGNPGTGKLLGESPMRGPHSQARMLQARELDRSLPSPGEYYIWDVIKLLSVCHVQRARKGKDRSRTLQWVHAHLNSLQ